MSDYDQRQYGLMLDRIEAFSSGQIYISTVLSDLEGLMLSLEDRDKEWEKTFYHYWGDIEEIRAVALYREREMDEGEMQDILKSLNSLKALISSKVRFEPENSLD